MKFTPKSAFLASLALVALTGSTYASEDAEPVVDKGDIVVLNKTSFDTVVKPEALILVEFFAPWCGHCKALEPEYKSAASILLKESPAIKLAQVDCTVEEDLCQDQGVQGYPTLKVFRNGVASEYNGPRKEDGIVSYMKKQALPSLSSVSAAELAEFKTKDKVVLVGFFEKDSADLKNFAALADKQRDTFVFGHVADAEAAKAEGVKIPSIVLYRTFDDEHKVVYDGKVGNTEDIESFIKAESIPLIDEVGPENFVSYADAGLPLAYYFTEPEGADKEKDLEAIKKIAAEYRKTIKFVWIDAVKFVNHAKGLNLAGEKWPAFAIQVISANTKYPLDNLGSDHGAAIKKFVAGYAAGKLQPSIKSEPIPTQDGPVTVLVADEFDKIVFDESKDVFVEFYAPWCGHCKKLAPIYDELGEKFTSVKDKLVIAKMDATANDLPAGLPFQVQSFPTIKFKPAGSRDWIDFEGDRSLEGMSEFIVANAKNNVSVAAAGKEEAKAATPAKDAPAPEHVKHEEL